MGSGYPSGGVGPVLNALGSRATSILIGSSILSATAASILCTGEARQYPTLPTAAAKRRHLSCLTLSLAYENLFCYGFGLPIWWGRAGSEGFEWLILQQRKDVTFPA